MTRELFVSGGLLPKPSEPFGRLRSGFENFPLLRRIRPLREVRTGFVYKRGHLGRDVWRFRAIRAEAVRSASFYARVVTLRTRYIFAPVGISRGEDS